MSFQKTRFRGMPVAGAPGAGMSLRYLVNDANWNVVVLYRVVRLLTSASFVGTEKSHGLFITNNYPNCTHNTCSINYDVAFATEPNTQGSVLTI